MTERDSEGMTISRPVGDTDAERAAIARAVIDAATYMTLATADADGAPWATPVWFATRDRRELVWISSPDARHSRNIAARPEVGIVLFDSGLEPGAGQAVYVAARAEEVPEDERDRCIETFDAESVRQGLPATTAAGVRAPARHRLYRALASEHYVLGAVDERLRIDIGA